MKPSLLSYFYDKSGVYKFSILHSPIFLAGLIFKLYASAFLGGTNFTTLFIPFLKQYTLGSIDPYIHFFNLGIHEVFPYPSLMLYTMSLPGEIFSSLLTKDIFNITHSELFIYHLPILVADIFILLILSRWLKNKHTELLLFYWLSPILIYINYLHSQLDVIPIAFVFGFLYYLFRERWWLAFVFLAAAIASKFHIILLVPFAMVYLWRTRRSITPIISMLSIIGVVFVLVNAPRLFRPEFLNIVFNNREQVKLFDIAISLGDISVIYVVPLAYTILFIHSLTFKRFNRDTFIMFLGFSLGLLTLFIPPQPGWYFWLLPFLIYFYVKNNHYSKNLLVFLTLGYFIYFALIPNSDYLTIFAYLYPQIATLPNAHQLLTSFGLDANLISNLAFTLLQATLLLNVLWLYRRGVEQSKKQKLYNMPYLIGVAGDSGSGKSTLASLLTDIFGQHNIALIAGDAMHKWERGHSMWQKFTHLNPSANTLHEDLANALSLQDGEHIYRRHYDHETGTFTLPERMESKKLVIFEGLHSFYLSHMQRALDLKIFIMPEEQLRFHWKLRRDITERGYTKELVLEQLRQREPDAEQYIAVQKDHADIIVSLKSELDLTDQLGDDIEVQTYLEIQADTAVPMDQLIEQLSKYIKIEHVFNKDRQLITFRGAIEAETIERLSFSLTPELYDVTINPPEWNDNYNGILQLFVCYYIFHTLRFSQHGK